MSLKTILSALAVILHCIRVQAEVYSEVVKIPTLTGNDNALFRVVKQECNAVVRGAKVVVSGGKAHGSILLLAWSFPTAYFCNNQNRDNATLFCPIRIPQDTSNLFPKGRFHIAVFLEKDVPEETYVKNGLLHVQVEGCPFKVEDIKKVKIPELRNGESAQFVVGKTPCSVGASGVYVKILFDTTWTDGKVKLAVWNIRDTNLCTKFAENEAGLECNLDVTTNDQLFVNDEFYIGVWAAKKGLVSGATLTVGVTGCNFVIDEVV